ncbi:hypothetical protein [Bradyrhizobium sp. S3.7.6]
MINALGSALPIICAAQFSFAPLPTVTQIMAMLANTGATAIRIDVPWADTELAVGVYAVSPYLDGLIAAVRASGRSVVLVLDYGNRLYPGSGDWNLPPRDAASCAAFANYAAWLVGQYAGPDVWFEIYNEPNNPAFWASAVNPTQYAALLSACILKMRAAPKGATANIISAGVGSAMAQDDQNPFMKTVAATVGATTMAKLTAQTIHPYDANYPPEAVLSFIDRYRAAVPCSGPLVVTEWGYNSQWLGGDETKRALYVARMIGSAVLAGLPMVTIFSLIDSGPDAINPEMTFGLHRFDKTPKLAATAVKTMAAALAGTITYDAEKVGTFYRITLRKANGKVTKIIWSDAPVTSITEPMASVSALDDTNGARPWFRFVPGGLMITIGSTIAPQIITGT